MGPPGEPLPSYRGDPSADGGARVARNGLGVAALVLGIVSILGIATVFAGVVLGLLAVVFGAMGRSRARRGEATNGGVALAGIVTGAVGLVVSVLIVAAGVGFFFTHKTAIHDYTTCINQAQTASARTACAVRFRHQVAP